jgi:hypothetical protein
MRKLTIFIIIIIISKISLLAQTKILEETSAFGIPVKSNTAIWTVYPDDFRIYKEYKSYKNNPQKHPEQTLISVLSATSYDWDKQNFNYEIQNREKKYIKNKKIKKKDAFFELLTKLSFKFNGNQYAVIKYHIKENNDVIPFANILINNDKKWLIIRPQGELSKLLLTFTYLSTNTLNAIFKKKDTDVLSFNTHISSLYNSKKYLDFNKISKKQNI